MERIVISALGTRIGSPIQCAPVLKNARITEKKGIVFELSKVSIISHVHAFVCFFVLFLLLLRFVLFVVAILLVTVVFLCSLKHRGQFCTGSEWAGTTLFARWNKFGMLINPTDPSIGFYNVTSVYVI